MQNLNEIAARVEALQNTLHKIEREARMSDIYKQAAGKVTLELDELLRELNATSKRVNDTAVKAQKETADVTNVLNRQATTIQTQTQSIGELKNKLTDTTAKLSEASTMLKKIPQDMAASTKGICDSVAIVSGTMERKTAEILTQNSNLSDSVKGLFTILQNLENKQVQLSSKLSKAISDTAMLSNKLDLMQKNSKSRYRTLLIMLIVFAILAILK